MNSSSDPAARATTLVRLVRRTASSGGSAGSGGTAGIVVGAALVDAAVGTHMGLLSRHRFDDELRDGGLLADAETAATAAAWSAGYQAGLDEGMATGRALSAVEQAAADRRAHSLADEIFAAAEHVASEYRAQALAASDALLAAAFDIAEAIVGREVREHPRSGEDALADALALAPEHLPCVARLHPRDVEDLGDVSQRWSERDLTVVADASVAVGDCVISLPTGRIENRIADAVARAREVVLGPAEASLV